ncbi:hypothetical protein AH156_20075 [Salmonella enterica subsp. enterica serovar Enteritidis]|nr:hypothetical protein [Salmonella enterica subsp. enterica serovar Enteritidis]
MSPNQANVVTLQKIGDNATAIKNEQDRAEKAEQNLSNTKVDIQAYNLDQDLLKKADLKHDAGIAEAVTDAGDAQSAADKAQNTADTNTTTIKTLTTTGAVATNTTGVAQNKADIATKANQSDFVALQSDVKQKVDDSTYQQRVTAVNQRLDAAKKEREATNQTVAKHTAELADHENRISDLEAKNSVNFGKLKNEVEQNRKRASAGIAGVAAMANIPQVTADQNFSIGAGVGNTDGESALSVGFSARASQNIVVKGAVSNDTQHNFVVGAGVSYGW